MTRDAQKLNVAVVFPVCGSVLLLGILGYRMMFGNKNGISEQSEKENEKPADPKQSVEPSKTKTVNDVEFTYEESLDASFIKVNYKYSTPEEMLRIICENLIKDKSVKTKMSFFKKLTKIAYFCSLDLGWMNNVPKSVEECENMVKEFGLWNKYTLKLEKRIYVSVPIKLIQIRKRRVVSRDILNV